jgi:hypothetical protein
VKDGFVFVAGGYTSSYQAKDMVYSIRTQSTGSLVIDEVNSLITARGDIVAAQTSRFAYVVGGNTHANDFCEALSVVARYEFQTGLWTSLPSLSDARSASGMVNLKGILMVLGGEQTADNVCTSEVDLSVGLLAVDSVEVWARSEWIKFGSQISDHRFRSAAIGWGATESIFTFGGQKAYDPSCECFPTTNEVGMYRGIYDQAEAAVSTPTPTPPPIPQPTDAPDFDVTAGNDLCANAVQLEVLASGLGRFALAYGNTETANVDIDAPTCGNGVVVDQPGVWFKVVGTQGRMTALTCHEYTDYDSKLSVYDGSCGSLRCVGADDDGCGENSNKARVGWEATRGTIYYILVHGWNNYWGVGNYAIWVQAREPPNDQCAQAQGPLAIGDAVDGTSVFANLDFGATGAQSCNGAYGNVEGVWYYVIGTGTVMTADTCDARTVYDTKLHIFTGDCQKDGDSKSLTCVKGNDNNVECGNVISRKSLVRW